MTCIVGLVHEGVTYIGADSLGSNGYDKVIRKDRKVFRLKDVNCAVIGYTSSYRMGQLLMYETELIDPRDSDKVDHEYLVTKFIPNVIDLFDRNGFSEIDNNKKSGGEFLLGYKDKLYKVQADYQVGESNMNYDACGCGEGFALGSLHSTEGKYDPVTRVRMALEAATQFSAGVAPPFYILNTKNNIVHVC